MMINRRISAIFSHFNQVESPYIEPGLLVVFRLAVVLQIVALGVRSLLESTETQPVQAHSFSAISLVGLLLLLGYLLWPQLIDKLKGAYLPVALAVATVAPLLEHTISVYFRWQQNPYQLTGQELFGISWRVYVVLLIPLVLIAWQYTLRWVLIFSGVVILSSQALAIIFLGGQYFLHSDLTDLSLRGTVTFLIVGYIMARIMQTQRKQRQALIEANLQLVDYAKTAEQLAVSRERNRLARDLHDTLAHTLSALSIQLEAVDSAWEDTPEQARMLLVKSIGATRCGLADTRRALQALRAAPLEDLGLTLAVRTLAEAMALRAGAKLVLDIPAHFTLAPEVEQGVYQIAREALTNIAKHAHAQKIQLTLLQRNATVILTITDDGIGFDASQPVQAEQYGLLGMRERALLIGAQLQVESQPRRGTTVQLTLATHKTGAQSETPRGMYFETAKLEQAIQTDPITHLALAQDTRGAIK